MNSGRWHLFSRVSVLSVLGRGCWFVVVRPPLRTLAVGLLVVGILWLTPSSQAAGPWTPLQDTTIEVTSQGAVEVAPDIIWIEGQLSGSGDLPEAQKILQGLKGDIGKALDNPEFAAVKVEYSRRLVRVGGNSQADIQRQMMEMMGEGPAQGNDSGEFTVSEDYRLVLSGLTPDNFADATERMLQLASALSDRQIKLGKQTGMNPYNPFGDGLNAGQFLRVGLADPAAVWKSASQAAFANAQSQAGDLAEIAGGKLGPALSISVDSQAHAADDDSVGGLQELFLAQYSGVSPLARSEVSRTQLDNIPLRVTLRVRFAFQPAGS